MVASPSSTVVPLGYSVRSIAKRHGCSPQVIHELINDDELPAYTKDGQMRIPRGYETGFDSYYDTNCAWADALRFD